MGNIITRIYGSAMREIKMYNIENRAEKVISRDKPKPAPKYPSTMQELDRLKEENVSKEYLYEKNKQLDSYLKKVYVTTPNVKPNIIDKKSEMSTDRHLPQVRSTDYDTVYGYSESEERTVPAGRLSLKQALQLVADHRSDPKQHSNEALAAQYKLPITLTDDIIEHFKVLDVHINKEESSDETSYQKLERRVREMNLMNASSIVKEFPQFKKKYFRGNRDDQVTEVTEKDNVTIDLDSNSDIKKDKKQR